MIRSVTALSLRKARDSTAGGGVSGPVSNIRCTESRRASGFCAKSFGEGIPLEGAMMLDATHLSPTFWTGAAELLPRLALRVLPDGARSLGTKVKPDALTVSGGRASGDPANWADGRGEPVGEGGGRDWNSFVLPASSTSLSVSSQYAKEDPENSPDSADPS